MTPQTLERYAQIKKQIKALEAEADKLNKQITDEMTVSQMDKAETNFGLFYFTYRKQWKYSETVDKLTAALKETKKTEEENGTATYEESKSLTFKETKENV